MFPVVFWKLAKITKYSWDYSTSFRLSLQIANLILFFSLYLLQWVWYRLMVIGFLKAFGCIKKKVKDVDNNKVED
jgi:hypothetical protein